MKQACMIQTKEAITTEVQHLNAINFAADDLLHCGDKLLDLSKPRVMGILNLSSNSFAAQGRFSNFEQAVEHALCMVEQGAAIIDIGAEPTNPKLNSDISAEQELQRLLPVIEQLSKEISVPISVDTSKATVMQAVIAAGATFINDVRALREPGALAVVAESGLPVCLMHMRHPYRDSTVVLEPMQNIVDEVLQFLQQRVQVCIAAGIKPHNIVLDPGIGHGLFGKNLTENLQLLHHLEQFVTLGFPILIGTSRKTFIGEQLQLPVDARLSGSIAAAVMTASKGAKIIRTHDVLETTQALDLTQAILETA